MKIFPLKNSLAGEQVIGVVPELALNVNAGWQRRMNLYTGRNLSDSALTMEQNERAGRLATAGQMFSLGVVNGLEVVMEREEISDSDGENVTVEYYYHVNPGLGLTFSGEDVVIPRTMRVRVGDIPVYTLRALLGGGESPGDTPTGALYPRELGPSLAEFVASVPLPENFPRAGVLVLQPVVVEVVGEGDPNDSCEQDPANYAYEDWQMVDGCQLVLYTWPSEWRALPAYEAGRWQNRIAYTIFDAERQLTPGDLMPWEAVGVPVALVGFEPDWTPLFVDRYAVVRDGGKYRRPHALLPGTGDAFLWQARVRQFAEHIADVDLQNLSIEQMAAQFRYLPPVSLLPKEAVDPISKINRFFPATYDISIAPVPREQLDLVIEASASLQPFDTFTADQVRVLVPVPQNWYEPALLVQEVESPEFATTLNELVLSRAATLRRRENVRAKASAIIKAITGQPPLYRADSDQLELDENAGVPSFPGAGAHRSANTPGMHQHYFFGTANTLNVGVGSRLFVYIYIDPENLPLQVLLQWRVGDSWEHRAYWGQDRIAVGVNGTPSRFRVGDRPTAGRWIRLEVPAGQVGLEDQAVNGLAFTLFDGRAAWGAAGLIQGGETLTWFDGEIFEDATVDSDAENWDWVAVPHDLESPLEDSYDTEYGEDGAVIIKSVRDLKTKLQATDLRNDTSQTTSIGRIDADGLEKYIAALDSKIARADDTIDLGFTRVQTDIYRIRQLVLSSEAATRLAVSPALASIAKAESAMATQEQLNDFYTRLKNKPVTTTASASAGMIGGVGGLLSNDLHSVNLSPETSFRSGDFSEIAIEFERTPRFDVTGDVAKVALTTDVSFIKPSAPRPDDVQQQQPITGSPILRSASIAERIQEPKAPEAKNFTAANKRNVLGELVNLDIALDGLQVPDRPTAGQTGVNMVNLADFRDPARLNQILIDPEDVHRKDEAAFFSAGVDLIDHTVAALRIVEGRIQTYKNARTLCVEVLNQLRGLTRQVDARLKTIGDDLAEVRHDIAIGRALLAEEQARVKAINERRASIIAEWVDFLVFYRPRAVDALLDAPVRSINPAVVEAPVPVCLSRDVAVPDELRNLVALLRDVPVKWFTAIPELVNKLDHVQALQDTLVSAKARAQIQTQAVTPRKSGGSKLGLAIGSVLAAQQQVVSAYRAEVAQVNLAQVSQQSWKRSVDFITDKLSPGDLIDGRHGRSDLAQQTARELDNIARVAACLYEQFGEVLPAIRLDWAERISQYDAPVNLRNLASLPRWNEIEYLDRREMQGMVDWLFQRIDTRKPEAANIVNDLVRVCILLASHAPVSQIIAGHVPKPAVVKPGSRITLAADISKLRVGMHVFMYSGANVTARGVVEDLGDGGVAARVIETEAETVQLEANARVQFAAPESAIFKSNRTFKKL